MKYIVVTGGVVSGLGKGVTISSMGRLLQACGQRVTAIKIDPYLNVDAGTMSPFEHGEVFVLDDGGESDLDLGNYERFLNVTLTSNHNVTTGKVYRKVILAERKGEYLGKTVQVVPHITDCIQDWLEQVAHVNVNGDEHEHEPADICLIEVGGTVGDIESSVFLEALRQFQFRVGHDNFCLCFVSLVPVLNDEEQKTKPTQHGVRDLRSLGLSPHVIFGRSTIPLTTACKTKISSFCHVPVESVLSVHDVANVYHVPGLLQSQNLHVILQKQLGLNFKTLANFVVPRSIAPPPPPAGVDNANANNTATDVTEWMIEENLKEWKNMANAIDDASQPIVKICLIGKYTGLQDSYLSVIKALKHASIACKTRLQLEWVEATLLEEPEPPQDKNSLDDDNNNGGDGANVPQITPEARDEAWRKLRESHGVVVPGGFGQRGWEGKLVAAHYCRLNGKPYLGVCLGFQAMIVEYARHVLDWPGADSTEVQPNTPHPTIIFMPEIDKTTMGGTMRLGARLTKFTHGHDDDDDAIDSTTLQLYTAAATASSSSSSTTSKSSSHVISERHRHRYEVNPAIVDQVHEAGLHFVGRDAETEQRMEVAELPRTVHPYYVGVQFHPEFKSRPLHPSPPFHGLVLAAAGQLDDYLDDNISKNKAK